MHFRINCSGSFYPVQSPFYFTVCIFHTASGSWVVAAFQLNDIAICIFNHFIALDDVGMYQTNFLARFQTEEFIFCFFFEVFPFNIDIAAERNLIAAQFRLVWINFSI